MKSVRIRKALPGEKPGYYNKTAKFLNKALPKAQMGMQVGNGLQDKMQIIMLDTYTSVRDGGDPQEVFRKLLMEYGMPQEMAYKVMQTVMQKLAQDGYADPASLEQDQEEQVAQAPQEQSEPSAPMMQNQNPGTPDEDEQLALSEAEGDTGYDAMDYYNDRSVEEQEQQELSKYGGPLRRKLKRAQQGMQQPSEEEMMMMQQSQAQPEQQQGGGDQMQQIMQQVGQALQQGANPEEIIAQLLQGQIPPEAIMQIFVEFGMGEEQVGQVIQSVMQQLQGGQEQQMSQEQMMRYGGFYNNGGEYDNYFGEEEEAPEDTVINQYSNPGQLSMEQKAPMSVEAMLQSFNLPSSDMQTPDLNAYLQGMYNYQNVGSNDIPNDLLPTSQAMYGGALDKYANGGPGKRKRKKAAATTTTTETSTTKPKTPTITENINPTVVREQQQSVLKPGFIERVQNSYYTQNPLSNRSWMGTGVEALGQGLNYLTTWTKKGKEKAEPSTTATIPHKDIMNIIKDAEYEPQILKKNADGTYNSGLAFNMGPDLSQMLLDATDIYDFDAGKPIKLRLEDSQIPELDFLSLHNDLKNTKIKLEKDDSGFIKGSIITDVKTKLKGYDKNNVVIKDEFYIDPKNKQILDAATGMPLEQVKKTYYTGNQQNWYNRPYSFPFTSKYPNVGAGQNIELFYPKVVSGEPLKKEPMSLGRTYWNTLGKGAFLTPLYPFIYPGFAERAKFYPNAEKVTAPYLSRQRELGPQAPGGMTFGDQPFGTQYADYELLKNRNYRTGRNFMVGAGLLGTGLGLGYLYYNRDTGDMEVGTEKYNKNPFQIPTKNDFSGAGRSYDTTGFGINIPITRKDSMYVSPSGDTIHNKVWAAPAADYKHGGAHKKKFLKNIAQMFEPGGEAQDPSLGKGSRLDNLDRDVAKKKEWVPFLKKQSDKAANEDLYKFVKKSGDPKLMNIFMGNNQQEQPQDNQMMQQPQFGEMGGFVNMDMDNPLTRFVYGGYDEAPDYYESEVLPEAVDGTPRCPKDYTFNTSTGKCEKNGEVVNPAMDPYNWFLDYTGPDNWPNAIATNEPGDKELAYTLDADGNKIYDPTEEAAYEKWFDAYTADTPEAEGKRFQDYQNYLNFYTGATNTSTNTSSNNKSNNNTSNTQTKCGPGTVWIEAYGQCVPIMKTKLNTRIVSGEPGLQNIILPWNPIFKTRGYKTKYGDRLTLKDLQKYAGKDLGDPYATLTYRKNMLSPKRQLDIWNPDGKLSEADMRALMDYGVGKGWNKKGSKNKSSNANFKSRGSDKNTSKSPSREELESDLKKRMGYSDEEWANTSKKDKRREIRSERYTQGKGLRYKTNEAYENLKDSAVGDIAKFYGNIGKKIIKPFTKKK
jgi:hypothetical protein